MPSTTQPALAAPTWTPAPTTAVAGSNQTEKSAPPPPVTVTVVPTPTITVSVPPPVAAPPWWWPFGRSSPNEKAELIARITYQYNVDQAQLKAALATASPETRPALLKAIAVSQTGYETAIQALEQQP